MPWPDEQYILRIMSGEARGAWPTLLRGAMAAAEPIYTAAVRRRNRRYDRGTHVHRLPRPVISIGNITAGGTGKTPMVVWLAEHLRTAGHHPGILLRGYHADRDGHSDESTLLAEQTQAPVVANPDRFTGGTSILTQHPDVDVLLLDDGFQHRRLHRNLDLVLIDALQPFGFRHVHPRGLLREPLSGLSRAGAIILTRCNLAAPHVIDETISTLRSHTSAPIYRCAHEHRTLLTPAPQPLTALAHKKFFLFCGIGNPRALATQLNVLAKQHRAQCVGHHFFADHHHYTPDELSALHARARAAGAEVLVTTEKDWTKLRHLATTAEVRPLPLWRVDLSITFSAEDEQKLMAQVNDVLRSEDAQLRRPA